MRELTQLTTEEIHELGHVQELHVFAEHMQRHLEERVKARINVPLDTRVVFNVIAQDSVAVIEAE